MREHFLFRRFARSSNAPRQPKGSRLSLPSLDGVLYLLRALCAWTLTGPTASESPSAPVCSRPCSVARAARHVLSSFPVNSSYSWPGLRNQPAAEREHSKRGCAAGVYADAGHCKD
eukprot:363607-Chlamydomonas_euryale.AAC.13